MFAPDTVVADALAMHPKARWVFAAYHVGGCNSCERAGGETLQELADGYRIPLDRFLDDLNALLPMNPEQAKRAEGIDGAPTLNAPPDRRG